MDGCGVASSCVHVLCRQAGGRGWGSALEACLKGWLRGLGAAAPHHKPPLAAARPDAPNLWGATASPVQDEAIAKMKPDKLRKLLPFFRPQGGTVTGAALLGIDWGAALAYAAALAGGLPSCLPVVVSFVFLTGTHLSFLHCPALQLAMPRQSPTARRLWCWRRGGRCGSTACRWWGGCWGSATRREILGTSPQHPHSPFQRRCSTQVGCWAGGGGAGWGLGPGAQRPAHSAQRTHLCLPTLGRCAACKPSPQTCCPLSAVQA